MLTYHLQVYWWFIISLLGAILVFLLFVQGGQSMLLSSRTAMQRTLMVNSLGRKWEFSFTTLVVFGGAFFASFPLFYSTSFGGAYWLWMLILFSFTFQAVRKGNIYGTRLFDTLLFINGCVGCVLLGVAVGMFFFGGEFTVERGNILNVGSPVISRWASTHGFEAIWNWRNLLLGFTVLFLARSQAALFFMNNIADDPFLYRRIRRTLFINGSVFVVLFLIFLAVLFTYTGYTTVVSSNGTVTFVPEKYKFISSSESLRCSMDSSAQYLQLAGPKVSGLAVSGQFWLFCRFSGLLVTMIPPTLCRSLISAVLSPLSIARRLVTLSKS